jgi:hypothetical protein
MNADVGRLSPADQGSGVRDPTDADAHRFTAEDGQETSAFHVNWADRSPTLIAEANHIKTLTHAPPLMAHTHSLPFPLPASTLSASLPHFDPVQGTQWGEGVGGWRKKGIGTPPHMRRECFIL